MTFPKPCGLFFTEVEPVGLIFLSTKEERCEKYSLLFRVEVPLTASYLTAILPVPSFFIVFLEVAIGIVPDRVMLMAGCQAYLCLVVCRNVELEIERLDRSVS